MIAEIVSSEEYNKAAHDYGVVFNDIRFCELNADKVEKVIYLLIKKGGSLRFGICFGIQNGTAKCPFSAPFSFPITLKENPLIEDYDEAIKATEIILLKNGIGGAEFIFPPLFYDKNNLSAWLSTLIRYEYRIINTDIDHALYLPDICLDNYIEMLRYNTRRDLKIALKSGLTIQECKSQDKIMEAYQIIAEHHAAKGYPLKMTWRQVSDTIEIVTHHVIMVEKDGENIAAALIFQVSEETAQVIYWGDKIEYRDVRPMNFLAYELIKIYKGKEIKYLDIGPSTENGIPNYGLCDFKERIGCRRDLKFKLVKTFV